MGYWAPQNARILGAGKCNAAFTDEYATVFSNTANYRDSASLQFQYGQTQNTMPELPGASSFNFSMGGWIQKNLSLGFLYNQFNTAYTNVIDENGDTNFSKDVKFSRLSLNGSFATKENVIIGFSINVIEIDEVRVGQFGFSLGKDFTIYKNKKHHFTSGFSGGIVGINEVFDTFAEQVFGKKPTNVSPIRTAITAYVKYQPQKVSPWFQYANVGAEYHQYFNYAQEMVVRFGTECRVLDVIMLRGGYFFERGGSDRKIKGFSYGAGLWLPFGKWIGNSTQVDLKIDVAFMPFPQVLSTIKNVVLPPQPSFDATTAASVTFLIRL